MSSALRPGAANSETFELVSDVSQSRVGWTHSLIALHQTASCSPSEHSGPWTPNHRSHLTYGGAERASFVQKTSFAPEVIEELERTHPQVLVWLRKPSGVVFQLLLISFYIVIETASSLTLSFTLKPNPPPKFKPVPSSIIVMKSGVSIIIGLMISLFSSVLFDKTPCWRALTQTFGASFQCRAILSYSLVAALLCISDVFTMLAYSKLDAGLKKILDQSRLPITAAMSSLITGKRYSMHEWLALFIVLMAISSFYVADVEHQAVTELHTKCRYPPHCFDEPGYDICAVRVDGATLLGAAVNGTRHDITTLDVKASKRDWQGFVFSLISNLFNCAGSLFFEKIVKKTASTPFSTQKVQMEATGFPVAMAMSFIVPLYIAPQGGKAVWWAKNEAEGSGEGFFQGYTQLTVAVIAIGIVQAWMSGIIVKQLSALVKQFAKCFILLATVFCTSTFFRACQEETLPLNMYSLAFVIAFATVLFATMPKSQAAVSSA